LTTLYSFAWNDGAFPSAGLFQATDGNFHRTTWRGGSSVAGTIFQITPGGLLTALHDFEAPDGGAYTEGTAYRLSTGLGPCLKTVPTAGRVGRRVAILGTNLTGATAVTFDGAAAVFTIVSGTEIGATVPAGVTTGAVHATCRRRDAVEQPGD